MKIKPNNPSVIANLTTYWLAQKSRRHHNKSASARLHKDKLVEDAALLSKKYVHNQGDNHDTHDKNLS